MERNKQFDVLLVIGITYVVVGHCGGFTLFQEWFPAGSFHMPLFFFISGYFYKKSSEDQPFQFIKRKVYRFVIPYYCWNLFYMLLSIFLYQARIISQKCEISLHTFFLTPFGRANQFNYNHPAWFILTLFLVEVVYLVLKKWFVHNNEWLILLLVFIFGCLGVQLTILGYRNGIFLIFSKTVVGLVFYHLGHLYKEKGEMRDLLPNVWYFLILFCVQLLIFKATDFHINISMWDGYYNDGVGACWWPFVTALPGILFCLRVSRIMNKALGDSKIIQLISRNTFSIMMHHQLAVLAVNILFLLVSNWIYLPDFDLYNSGRWYFYTFGVDQVRIIYVIAAFVIPLMIHKLELGIKCTLQCLVSERQ